MKKKLWLMVLALFTVLALLRPETAHAETPTIIYDNSGYGYCCVGEGFSDSVEGTIYIDSTGKYYYYLTGWKMLEGNWYYFDPYMYANGIAIVNGNSYYFANDGIMQTGWIKEVNSGEDWTYTTWYYARSDGALLSGWQKINNKWYYFDPNWFYMYTEIENVNGYYYYFGTSGAMQTGWIKEVYSGEDWTYTTWYYARSDGALLSEWQKINNKWYYFDPYQFYMYSDGVGNVNGNDYYFDKDGAMQSGLFTITHGDGTYYDLYYTDSNGVLQKGWQFIDGKWYYFEPYGYWAYRDGSYDINGKTYVFDDSGVMLTGLIKLEHEYEYGVWYNYFYANSSGVCQKGWIQYNNKWYYGNPDDGQLVCGGEYTINDKIYLFDDDAALVSKVGWVQQDGNWYYCNTDGTIVTGWKSIGGKWYYFYPNYGIMVTGYHVMEGVINSFTKDGEWLGTVTSTGWHQDPVYKGWFYVLSNGKIATGWQWINGKWYYFYPDYGEMAYSTTVYPGDNKVYFMSADGSLVNKEGWQKVKYMYGGSEFYDWYYVGADGVCKTGWQKISGTWYYFDLDNACMYSNGNYWIDDILYAFDASGAWIGYGGQG